MQSNKTPKIFVNLFNPEVKIGILRYVISFFGVIILGSALIIFQNEDPVNAAKLILEGSFGSMTAIGNTLRWTTPCMLTGAAGIIAFKSGINNLGIEGQMYVGALTAAIVGFVVELPPVLHVAACIVMAGIAGVLWVLVPALMRLFFNINEYVTTMMMNFVAMLLTDYITLWIIMPGFKETSTTIRTPSILSSAKLPTIIRGTSASYGFYIALFICLFVYVLYKYTIKGYELKQVGDNIKFAKAGGVNTTRTFISIFVLSGFIAGVCGGIEVTGGYYRYISNFSSTMGWDGIMIANISGRNPIALIFVSFVWGMLKTGAMHMERATTLNRLTVNLLQMIFVLLVSINYEGIINHIKNKWNKRKMKNQMAKAKEGHYVQ